MRTLVLASLALCASAGMYKNHHLFAVKANTDAAGAWLVESGYDLWNEPVVGQATTVQMRVAPENVTSCAKQLAARNIEFQVVDEDIEPEFDAQKANRKGYTRGVSKIEDFDYFEYHTYEEIIDWIHDMHAKYPHVTEIIHIGWSTEERELVALQITGNATVPNKKKSWHNFAIHAREWLSPASGLYIAGQLLEQYSTSSEVQFLVNNIEWTFLMVMNPDGYHTTWTDNRMWRKSRAVNQGSTCIGTDLNRNFGYQWGQTGSSGDPCSETYRGTAAFSQPETAAVASYIESKGYDGYVDWHCCGAMWMTPWGYTTTLPAEEDYRVQMHQNEQVAAAIAGVKGTRYAYGPSSIVIYVTSGATVDWTYGHLGIVLSVTVELPGSFTSPPTAIEGVVEDVWAGTRAYGFALINENNKNHQYHPKH